MAKIGICDWGIGGLGVYKALRENLHSKVDVIYFSDAGFTPYGKVPADELHKRWLEVNQFLLSQGAEEIIVACNALSTVVKPEPNVITIASSVNRIVERHCNVSIGVIGGVRTIESGIYDQGCENHCFQIAQPLSALVEKGIIEGREVEEAIHKIIGPISKVRKVVLACTHYPVLIPVFNKLYPSIEFIDPLVELIKEINANAEGENILNCYTSGDAEETSISANKAWNIRIDDVRSLNL